MDMAKKPRPAGDGSPNPQANPSQEAAGSSGQAGKGSVGWWTRDDGAICYGNECVVLSGSPTGDLKVEVNPNNGCEVQNIAELIFDTVGRGGETTFKVQKGNPQDEPKA